jgi:hypothetical protein
LATDTSHRGLESGVAVPACLLLICGILAALRQEVPLSYRAHLPSHLSPLRGCESRAKLIAVKAVPAPPALNYADTAERNRRRGTRPAPDKRAACLFRLPRAADRRDHLPVDGQLTAKSRRNDRWR